MHYLAGEHDAALDQGADFKEFFGQTTSAIDHKGVHFIALDNATDPKANIGVEQLAWLDERPEGARLEGRTAPLRPTERRESPIQAGCTPGFPSSTTKRLRVATSATGSRTWEMVRKATSMRVGPRSTLT